MSSRVTLPEKQFGGYIFDLDGTLVDSMQTHYKAWRWALKTNGAPHHVFLWDEFLAHGGMAAPDIVADLNHTYGLQMEPYTVATMKREHYDYLLETEQLPIIPETVGLVRELQEAGIPYAIGTGSVINGARATLRSAGIEELFPIIVTPDDVPPGRGKPEPDIFLLAAERMGIPATECVVFEDAEPGIQAAVAAGMAYVRVAS
ncbi:MAG: HAD family phosphatase [Akkermansia sp.]|nr:HAD family phosphatase [Akkermansia sp.]